jgi:glycosyltransferase involved in cell wall biosynthesis
MVTPSFYPIEGGAEEVVATLAAQLVKIGIDTDIMTFNMDKKWSPSYRGRVDNINGLRVFRIPALNWFPLTHSKRVTLGINLIPGRFQNRFKEYDLIHFHHGDDLTFPLFSIFINRQKILHLHGFDLDFYKRYVLARCILKGAADLLIAYTKLIKEELIELGIPRTKIEYLPNGIDVSLFRPSEVKEDNLILFVGRITFIKGLHVLLKSLIHVRKPVRLVIIGPSAWDSDYFKEILTSIDNLKKRTKHEVTYLGKLKREETIRWYQKASMLVRPDILGISGGLTALEASACGTAVIGTGNEVVKPHVSGILVSPNDTTELTTAIQYLFDNKDVREKLEADGRRWVVENFSFEVVTERLRQIYLEMLINQQRSSQEGKF